MHTTKCPACQKSIKVQTWVDGQCKCGLHYEWADDGDFDPEICFPAFDDMEGFIDDPHALENSSEVAFVQDLGEAIKLNGAGNRLQDDND